ncbi:hypothetical protein AMTR_s00024p00253140 [Amborella trichopoda]|uniref:Aminotransferase-like plant mobile domain-containing protein n=1 Tax=Amborella trichopoda TaxID=13333 RepID=W1PUH5_AMBTC|nr:hypothetical protein AMTR_s00024p00253140 [Amborella trichopoda]
MVGEGDGWNGEQQWWMGSSRISKSKAIKKGYSLGSRCYLFSLRGWVLLLIQCHIRHLARIGLWEICRIRPCSLDLPLIIELCLRFRSETGTFPFSCGELGPTLDDATHILGVRSEGDPYVCTPLGPEETSIGIFFEIFDGDHPDPSMGSKDALQLSWLKKEFGPQRDQHQAQEGCVIRGRAIATELTNHRTR